MGFNYAKINKEDLTPQMRKDCVETVPDDGLRTSMEATPQVILKWLETEKKPVSLGSVTVYTKAEIHIEFAKPEWSFRGVKWPNIQQQP